MKKRKKRNGKKGRVENDFCWCLLVRESSGRGGGTGEWQGVVRRGGRRAAGRMSNIGAGERQGMAGRKDRGTAGRSNRVAVGKKGKGCSSRE